jgi:hypothetical protein
MTGARGLELLRRLTKRNHPQQGVPLGVVTDQPDDRRARAGPRPTYGMTVMEVVTLPESTRVPELTGPGFMPMGSVVTVPG